jgi:hypothetical protein
VGRAVADDQQEMAAELGAADAGLPYATR